MTNLCFKIFILVFFISMLFSCKTEQPAIKQTNAEVYFRYIASQKELHAETFFSEIKTKTTPVTWDNVLFVNMPMKKRQLSPEQIRYIIDLTQEEFKSQYFVKFWNKGQLPRQINITPTGINSFSLQDSNNKIIESLNKEESILLKIDSPAFAGNEKITLLFTNENNESASLRINLPNAEGISNISAKALATIPTGICKAELIITKAEAVETPAAKATVISEFYSKPIQVIVE